MIKILFNLKRDYNYNGSFMRNVVTHTHTQRSITEIKHILLKSRAISQLRGGEIPGRAKEGRMGRKEGALFLKNTVVTRYHYRVSAANASLCAPLPFPIYVELDAAAVASLMNAQN